MSQYFECLEETIRDEAEQILENTLCESLAHDLARDIADAAVERETTGFREVRYVLMDGETGQLESRMLYDDSAEAEKESKEPRHGKQCIVATLLC